MKQRKLAVWGFVSLVSASLTLQPYRAQAVPLDKEGEIKLGVRAYGNARIGTEKTDKSITFTRYQANGQPDWGRAYVASDSQTFPLSSPGHLRQNRYYIEAEMDHDLSRLTKEGFGPLALLSNLPFKIRGLKYHATFRGEADLIYDWGPNEYSTSDQYIPGSIPAPVLEPFNPYTITLPDNPIATALDSEGNCPLAPDVQNGNCFRRVNVLDARRKLRQLGTDRERLFQAYLEGSVGDLFFRFGRQVWSWGETDGFRLLDQINPIDSSFGGFLISLDERRVPLDMLRLEYRLGEFGPISEMAVHAYGAVDNKVGFAPGTPAGSPWTLPNLGKPSATTRSRQIKPSRTLSDIRGGGRLYWNMFDATFSLAHYYTYFDVPALQVYVRNADPSQGQAKFPLSTFNDGYSAHAIQTAPLVQVTGGSTTFVIPSAYARNVGLGGEPVIRSEFAYFRNEPRFRQSRIDPFTFVLSEPSVGQAAADPITRQPAITGGRELGDSVNYVLGMDLNQYIRFLNPYQSFFISTQFFYKHLVNPVEQRQICQRRNNQTGECILVAGVEDGEVLPVPQVNIAYTGQQQLGAVEPRFIRQNTDQFLQTLFIGTSYMSGQVNPGLLVFYDWSGAFVYQPSIQFSHDPWRFAINYSILDAGTLKGNSGVSLLRDRDNVLFQLEYAI
jgi:hypothetical protein